MNNEKSHISVCICTYKRPDYLRRVLFALAGQETAGLFTYSIVVVDNDQLQSAETVVENLARTSLIPIKYCTESRQNIARARNKALDNATGSLVAFIDDDEFPTKCWLLKLFEALQKYESDGVLGPVKPHYESPPPGWLLDGGFHERPSHPSGAYLDWNSCRTGNVLLKRGIFAGDLEPFRPECLSGEDQDFFRRMIAQGRNFVWCNEAEVYETVPPARWKRGFLIRRALFRGVFSLRNHGFPPMRIVRSIIAAPVYAATLPIAMLFGQGRFMRQAFKLSYHIGRLCAIVGVNPINRPYVTD
jgi:succinoglycan biosynthesis protein ExoM